MWVSMNGHGRGGLGSEVQQNCEWLWLRREVSGRWLASDEWGFGVEEQGEVPLGGFMKSFSRVRGLVCLRHERRSTR